MGDTGNSQFTPFMTAVISNICLCHSILLRVVSVPVRHLLLQHKARLLSFLLLRNFNFSSRNGYDLLTAIF